MLREQVKLQIFANNEVDEVSHRHDGVETDALLDRGVFGGQLLVLADLDLGASSTIRIVANDKWQLMFIRMFGETPMYTRWPSVTCSLNAKLLIQW